MRPSAQMREANLAWLNEAARFEHLFRQRWMGARFFHPAGDMLALQELIGRVRPTLLVHAGVAAGGGPIFSASMLELLGTGRVAAIDPSLRPEGRGQLDASPLRHRIELLEGSSIDPAIYERVKKMAHGGPVFVILDLIHTHDHVLRELELYAELVTPGSYIVVCDTIMEMMPAEKFAGRPYGKGNNPGTAVAAFLAKDMRFTPDLDIEDQVLMTLSPGGFLRRAPG